MSYCRFSENSDVYMFEHVAGYITCCACNTGESQAFDTPKQALSHLIEHIERGDEVPVHALRQLLGEIREDILGKEE